MPSLPDTPWVLLAGFASVAWSTAMESILWGFSQTKQNFLNHLITVLGLTTSFTQQCFWLLSQCYGSVKTYHHHDVMPLARISQTLSRHFSLSFIASGRSSGLHPVSSHSCCMYVQAGHPAFAWPYAGGHRSTSFMCSSLLLQQCPARLVRLTWIVFVMGGRWPYSWCLVGCCRQDLFNIARNILV